MLSFIIRLTRALIKDLMVWSPNFGDAQVFNTVKDSLSAAAHAKQLERVDYSSEVRMMSWLDAPLTAKTWDASTSASLLCAELIIAGLHGIPFLSSVSAPT